MEDRIINFHQVVVHFPVALVMAGGAVVLASVWSRRDSWWKTGQWLLRWGTLAAVIAIWTGLNGEHDAKALGVPGELIERHEWLGFRAVAGLAVYHMAVLWKPRSVPIETWGRIGFALSTGAVMTAIAVTGHWGGTIVAAMVYR